ncbi:branched chain amino acid ABC transporter substrate-binding protein [Paramagnetospirillum kuznetsovii]|uniref:Branched chain amino acid ABC transporter substrate-binding protein n=1 Tax=Paramagnetospirillum kuznetsovii TaxID=2053833 RepID=A0A364NZF1_9PROT|nr:branched-chain amino acid ABC transporter substrate-binding protein [Paramagnetospirillum kuznetsovii]RAU22446.1 branched chain amino acid ABC transporter substrate-binding protein [Paramagnetospirillum kuznetsovii]
MTRTTFSALAVACAVLFSAQAARADITIGVAGPLSGSEAAFGEQFRRGAVKAVDDINAKGGVLGQKLVLAMGDDACDPKQAVAVANEMASKKVPFVAGHFCSGSSIPASDVYSETGILQISPASTNPKFTERGLGNVFRTCGRDDQQGQIAAQYMATELKGKVIGIVHDKSAYGKGLADQTKDALNKLGVKEAVYEAITAGEKDYSALVTKLKQAKVDVLYLGGYKTEGGLIVRQMRDQGLKTVLMGGDALVTEEYWSITGAAGEGTLMTFSPDPRKNPANADLVKFYRAQNYEPEAYTLYTYGTIQAWAQAAEKAKTTDAKKVAAVLKSEKFDTALGKIGFDAKGDVAAPGYVMYVWKNGKYDYAK